MIQMTDNQLNNTFAFFCDVCQKEIKDGKGEILFQDTDNPTIVTPVISHYGCSKRYEVLTDDLYGNMSLADFVTCLYDQFGEGKKPRPQNK